MARKRVSKNIVQDQESTAISFDVQNELGNITLSLIDDASKTVFTTTKSIKLTGAALLAAQAFLSEMESLV